MKPRKEGCEIEARRVTYKIHIPRRTHPFKIWSRDDAGGDGAKAEQEDHERGAAPRSSARQATPSPEAEASTQACHVLKDVSCRAKPWEVLAIVGPSGAGKSSLLEILAGKLVPPGEPAVFVNQKPLDPVRFRKVSGYVTQKDVLFPLLTALAQKRPAPSVERDGEVNMGDVLTVPCYLCDGSSDENGASAVSVSVLVPPME